MSSYAPAAVATAVPFNLAATMGQAFDPGQVVFTMPANTGGIIESVYLKLNYFENLFTKDFYILRLLAQNGDIMFTQPSPLFDIGATQDDIIEITWARGGNDTAQIAGFVIASAEPTVYGAWGNPPLPEFVLPPNGMVTIDGVRGIGTAAPEVQGTGVVVYTPAGGGSNSQALADVTPLLLSTQSGG